MKPGCPSKHGGPRWVLSLGLLDRVEREKWAGRRVDAKLQKDATRTRQDEGAMDSALLRNRG